MNTSSLAGSETTTGGIIIMPIPMRMLATIKSMMMNGTKM